MTYGYCRISRQTQNIDRQARNITEYDDTAKLIKEAFTGTTQARPAWVKLRRGLKPGDTVIFDSVSRMSRNAAEGFREYQELFDAGINLVFLKEHHIDTETYRTALQSGIEMTGNQIADIYLEATNRVLMLLAQQQIELAFLQAEKEVQDLHTRTSEGMKTAKLNGKQIGRPFGAVVITKKSIRAKAVIRQHSRDFGGTLNDTDVMKLIGDISRNSYYKYKAELKAMN